MHHDLGLINGPVLLFGGPYSNAEATRALLDQAAQLGMRPKQMICTGGVVGCCANPSDTIELIRTSGATVVAGVFERYLVSGEGAQRTDDADWIDFAKDHIPQDERTWLASRPNVVTFRHQGGRYAVIHGGITEATRLIWATSAPEVFEAEWDALEALVGHVDHVIAGHSGIPFLHHSDRGVWINAGTIGMPPHDGRQHTRYAVLDGGDVQIHRLRYDVEAAYAAMCAAGLTRGYHTGLRSGYWPSEEGLPEDLRLPSLASG